jgi:hypothetical protein
MMFKAILAALALLPLYKEDASGPEKTAQQTAIAYSLAARTQDPELVAFVIAWGDAETHYSLRVHAGLCQRWECDHGRARSPWQGHRNGMADERWSRMLGIENTDAQVAHALKMAAWALRDCHLEGDARVLSAFRRLGGLGCQQELPGEQKRLATYRMIRGRL